MKINRVESPAQVSPSGTKINTNPGPAALSGRDKAIAMISGATPPVNQNSVAPEEAKAVAAPTQTTPPAGLDVNSVEATSSAPSESPAAEETKAEEQKSPLSSQYAILARKEKALRAREHSLRVKEEAMKLASTTPAKPSEQSSKPSLEERIKSDPISVLNELGVTYEQLTNGELNKPSAEQQMISKLEAKIAALEEGTQKVNKRFEEQQTQSYQQAVKAIERETQLLVKSDPSFETIRETGSVSDVVELIEETFKRDGVLLSVEEAAREVEDYLVEEAFKLTRLKKIQQRLTPATKPAAPSKQEPTSKQPALKTLTNAVSSSRQLSARERAILAMEGKLNK